MTDNVTLTAPKKALGKGLSALIGDDHNAPNQNEPKSLELKGTATLSLSLIVPGPYQPRQYFDEESLHELADSIKEKGVLQPIIVTTMKENGIHSIIAGERRWRASKLAGLNSIPAVIKDISDKDALEIALIENVQRQDLNILEEAEGYQRLMAECNYTQEELSTIVSKSRSHISNLIRLLALPEDVRKLLASGLISMGHGRALLKTKEPSTLAERIVRLNLSVRQVESLLRAEQGKSDAPKANIASKKTSQQNIETFTPPAQKDQDVIELEKMIEAKLGLNVDISDEGDKGGRVSIQFHNLEQLDVILQKLLAA